MSAGSVAGALTVSVAWDGARAVDAAVALERPRAGAALRGRATGEALALVPQLFALCGRAQAAAARAALGAAGEPVPQAADPGGVLREEAQEHLWRLLRDWPRALGVPPRDEAFAAWYRRLSGPGGPRPPGPEHLAPFVDAEVLGAGFGALATRAELEAWAAGGASLAAALVRAALRAAPAAGGAVGWLPAAPLESLLDGPWGPDREVRPTHAGGPAETGALARFRAAPLVADLLARDGGSLLARLVARLVALADVARRLAEGAAAHVEASSPAPGVGLGRVETARGALVHRVRLHHGLIAEYAVVAPTAWNFHPRGAFAGACAGLRAASEEALRAEIGRWIVAFDPCVAWRVQVRRAAGAGVRAAPALESPDPS